MATKASAEKASKRPAKDSAKPARTSQEPDGAASQEPEQQPQESQPQPSALDSAPSVAERLEAQRQQLFKAISIVACCKYASATLLAHDDCEYMVPAFETICDLLDTSAGELERIAWEFETATERSRGEESDRDSYAASRSGGHENHTG